MPKTSRGRPLFKRLSGRVCAEISRGHVAARVFRRLIREAQRCITFLVLGSTRPELGYVTVATLDPSEENASATTAFLSSDPHVSRIRHISPDPAIARQALESACRRLACTPLRDIEFTQLRFPTLLRAYARSRQTYSTHVLLPGTDPSRSRVHVHLTHGSGPKPDKTFRGPTNVLASIVGVWIPAQFKDYGLPTDTPVLPLMPRLEIMRRASADRSIISQLGLDERKKLIVWAPTYRSIMRAGGEVRTSGSPFSASAQGGPEGGVDEIQRVVAAADGQLVAKVHPFDADTLEGMGVPVFTSDTLRNLGVTTYELFGAADLLITDYSSVYTERAALGLPFRLYCPDVRAFERSYRGFRDPHFEVLTAPVMLEAPADLSTELNSLGLNSQSRAVDSHISSALRLTHGGEDVSGRLYALVESAWS